MRKNTMYTVCFYVHGRLALEREAPNRDAAEMVVMDERKHRPSGFEVTIYRNDRALKGWDRKWVAG